MYQGVQKKSIFKILFYMLPAMLPLLIFYIIPVFVTFYISMTDWDYMSPIINYVGLENYQDILSEKTFYRVLWQTVIFCIGTVIPSIFGGMIAAILLQKTKFAEFYRTFIFAPYITPLVAVSIVWSWIFEPRVGIANAIIEFLGGTGLGWTRDPNTAMLAVIIVTVWSSIGYYMIFYMDALNKVPQDLYKEASLVGASTWQKFRRITLPLISPTTFFMLVLGIIDALQAYDQISVLTNGGPSGSTMTILYYYYFLAFRSFKTGEASAVGVILLIITALLSYFQFKWSKRWVHY
ncbi:carbohydrate ABC transporter permease [Fundicoccus culcitae]|uniref:Sugar ABC transporter permease n=1 Tax=Fundicoccus culcitae TaxID=2969821 RepID=A0ABY5P5F4_9LACT|nr:sugar ABC transporter permease [Fundicoccus culcitae]UUX33779.1 sugar ABC transporter permease [Fundicoccus culcitae]